MQESESSFLLGDEIVGDSITEADVAMELCKKVQVEEHVIHVVGVGSTNFYTRLRFFLLGSSCFPRPLGVCLWSALHLFLVLYEAIMLLLLFSIIFVPAVLFDAYLAAILIGAVLFMPFGVILIFIFYGIVIAFACLWLVITCKCCTMPERAPGQSVVEYIFAAAFGTTLDQVLNRPQVPQPVDGGAAPVVDRAALKPIWRVFWELFCEKSLTLMFVNHVILVSYPYRRAQLGDLCREIVPWYDTVVI